MSTNMTGGADGGIAIQVKLDTSKASKELTRLEQKILKLQEEVTVGKAKKSALVAQLEQANTELTALQAKTKIDGKNFVISPEDSKRISDLKIQIEQTQAAIEQQNKALSDTQLTLEGVKTRYRSFINPPILFGHARLCFFSFVLLQQFRSLIRRQF